MRQLGLVLLLLGLASIVVHFLNMDLRVLHWMDTWGEGPAWGFRAGVVVLGLLMVMVGKPKQSK